MSVLLGYLHPQELAASFVDSLAALEAFDAAGPQQLAAKATLKTGTGGIPEARNVLAKQTLDDGVEWLFMVDSDMGFAPDSLQRLLEAADPVDRPIVGGLCFAYREQYSDGMGGFRSMPRPTIFDFIKHTDGHMRFTGLNHYPVDSMFQCAGTGAAFLLIHRTVLERVRDEYGPTWFDRVRGTDGSLLGEDISFFVRTNALEIPCFVHTGVKTTHKKTIYVSDEDFWESFIPPPASEFVEIVGELSYEGEETLDASTGLVSSPNDLQFNGTEWVFLADDKARFRPGWLDHAQHVAKLHGAKVVQCGRYLMVDREYWLAKSKDEKQIRAKSIEEGVFQIAAGARVDG